jgi:hypothetical protein
VGVPGADALGLTAAGSVPTDPSLLVAAQQQALQAAIAASVAGTAEGGAPVQ